MTPLRIAAHVVMMIAVAMFSYPVFLAFVILFTFLFQRPYDVLVWAVVSDVLYATSYGYGINFSVLLTVIIVLIASMLVKKQLLFRGY